jgi:hypothetical protein
MHKMARMSALGAALAAVLAGGILLSGCGGDDEPAVVGGSISGTTLDGISGLEIGGVRVEVQLGGVYYGATSAYPGGQFTITGVPDGTYAALRVTPVADIYGGVRTVTVQPPIAVTNEANVALPAPILIVETPPPGAP